MASLPASYVALPSEEVKRMTYDMSLCKKTASGIVGVAAILFYLWLLTWTAPGKAMGLVAAPENGPSTFVTEAKIFKRGRSPVYPYVAKGPGPRGWSGYFGFVPYTKGNVENEAIERSFYPMNTWPHDPNAPVPQPYGPAN